MGEFRRPHDLPVCIIHQGETSGLAAGIDFDAQTDGVGLLHRALQDDRERVASDRPLLRLSSSSRRARPGGTGSRVACLYLGPRPGDMLDLPLVVLLRSLRLRG